LQSCRLPDSADAYRHMVDKIQEARSIIYTLASQPTHQPAGYTVLHNFTISTHDQETFVSKTSCSPVSKDRVWERDTELIRIPQKPGRLSHKVRIAAQGNREKETTENTDQKTTLARGLRFEEGGENCLEKRASSAQWKKFLLG
jgi:hypothetical protein